MFKDCTSTTDEINAETRGRRDAEKIENILATQVIDAAIDKIFLCVSATPRLRVDPLSLNLCIIEKLKIQI